MSHFALDATLVGEAEKALATDVPFGCRVHITQRVHSRYLALLSSIADHVVAARLLLAALETDEAGQAYILRDPLLRRTIEDGFCLVALGEDAIHPVQLSALLNLAAAAVASGRHALVVCAPYCEHISANLYCWARGNGHDLDLLETRFRSQWRCRVHFADPAAPTAAQLGALASGVRYLHAVAPFLASSMFSHGSIVAINSSHAGVPFNSLTSLGLPGTLLLSPTICGDPERVGEAILHECTHLKFMDLDYAESLFADGFRPHTSPTVTPPWHATDGKGNWPFDRILTAMHVYLCLAVFLARAARAPATRGSFVSIERSIECLARSQHLAQEAQKHEQFLSKAGVSFVRWIEMISLSLDSGGAAANIDLRAR
jgi:hypothetical protein